MSVIAFQGVAGAYSDLACRQARPGWETLPCTSFPDVIQAVQEGRADLGMLACENSLAGRVPEVHALLPEAGLSIIGEHFQRVEHCLIALPGVEEREIRRLHTHPVAIGQVRKLIAALNVQAIPAFDTAGAVKLVAEWQSREDAAVASELAAQLYGLTVLRKNVEDAAHNTTRFYLVARQGGWPAVEKSADTMTTVLFRVKNSPGALYAALRGFAEAGINLTRLESYMEVGSFNATGFLVDFEGHPEEARSRAALANMKAYADQQMVLGVYGKSPARQ
ncbi:prephenate dehydratase [Acetobacteraceae bacterium EV16G]|uniref:prephenate dehydratase n=1 Tax=Sorlinia euscelidii TaxID=3081148 RepID=A0ABU7U7F1_9PROT